MKYDISKASALRCRTSEKGQKASKSSSLRPQKTCTNPSFRCFSLFLGRTSAAQNFSILTSLGRNYVAKWLIW